MNVSKDPRFFKAKRSYPFLAYLITSPFVAAVAVMLFLDWGPALLALFIVMMINCLLQMIHDEVKFQQYIAETESRETPLNSHEAIGMIGADGSSAVADLSQSFLKRASVASR